jgi:subtilase family serine protease
MRKLLVPLFAVFATLGVAWGEPLPGGAPRNVGGAQTFRAMQHDESPALRDLVPIPPPRRDPSRREMRRHWHTRPDHGRAPAIAGLLAAPLVQDVPVAAAMPAPATSFDGTANVDGVLPPDPNGAVGPNHYVQWVNLSFAIYDKSGTLLYGPAAGNTLWAGFGGPCEEGNEGDPIVLHDHLADRWFMSQLALPNFPFGPFYQCIAVSQTADPTGAYHRYAFVVSNDKLNDYPKFGVWPDAYYQTVNQFDAFTETFLGQGVLAFDRDAMLTGRPAAMVYFDLFDVDPNLGNMLPADMDGPAPPPGSPGYFVQFDDDGSGVASQDQLQLWRFHVDWNNPSASAFTGPVILPTAPFDSNMCGFAQSCIPQRGTAARLDAIADRLMFRLQYRNLGDHESLVVNHTVDVGGDHAGIRWYEVRDPGGTPFIEQQGTYAPDAENRWMGSAAMDGAGNLAIGFSVSSATTFPSIRYAGRLVDDPPGTLAQGEGTLISGSGSQTDPSSRWGDYSALSVDPTDHCTFWYTQEYYAATSAIGWRTRVGNFRFPSCTSALPVVTVIATDATATEAGPTAGAVTFSRTGSTDAELVVSFTARGTATPGVDYVPLPTTATIPAGAASTTLAVEALDDSLIEKDETVDVTLSPDSAYTVGTPSAANVTIVNDDLPPDLVISALSAPASGGAGAAIAVTDTTKNQGGGAAAASTTGFYLSTNNTLDATDVALGSRPVPALGLGATSSASTSLTIPPGTTSGTYFLIAKADTVDALLEAQEGNNTSARSISIGPDLVVTALTVPGTAAAGAAIVVSETTKNQGGGPAGASSTRFYLSSNGIFDGGDTPLGGRAVAPLAPGATSPGSTSLTIPDGTAAGTYFIIARADGDGAVGETQEANNTSARSFQVGADLVVTALTAPPTAGPGVTITVSDTTANQGGGATGASTTALYLSSNALFDSSDVPLGSRAVPPLAPAATSPGSTSVTIPPGIAVGTYFIIARADDGNAVAESLETNNLRTRSIQVGPDLAIAALTVPTSAGPGAAISVSDTTKNQGGGPADASTTQFYLSSNSTLDGSDVPIGSRDVPGLVPGETSTASTLLTIPADTAVGAYYVIARADDAGAVAETQEGNNVSARSIQVGADLAVTALSAPTTAGAGLGMTVSDTTRNQGGGSAVASTTALYLSTNGILDAGDVLLGTRAVPSLAPGAASAGSTSVVVPPTTAVGVYYLIAQADAGGVVGESQETNNTTTRTVQIGPDLVMSTLSVPGTAAAGATITVGDTTKNQGGGTADATTTRFYLSLDNTFDAGDVPLGSRPVPALAPGGTSGGSTPVTIPADTAVGAYYVIARADADGGVIETQEGNNASARQIQVGPDLTVSALVVPSSVTAGATVTVGDTTRNQGGAAAGISTTRLYLSTNSTYDAADVTLGSRAIPALAPGATSVGSTSVTIPADTAPGAYFIIARADADDAVVETQEGNNASVRSVQVVAAP